LQSSDFFPLLLSLLLFLLLTKTSPGCRETGEEDVAFSDAAGLFWGK
jgi:hypothetical protein